MRAAWAIGRSKRNCIGRAPKSCSSATRQTPRPRRKPSSAPSPSRKSRVPAVGVCAPRFRSPSSTNRPPDPPKPTPSSPLRSKALRRRRKCPRSPRHRGCWQRLHDSSIRECFRARPIIVWRLGGGAPLNGNARFGRDTGPSRGDPCTPALRPIEASKAVVCYVRSTSKPVKLIEF
jgi:hypothetical protein